MLTIGSNINEMRIDGNLKALRSDLVTFLGFGLTAAEITVHGLDAIRNGRLDVKRTKEIAAIMNDYPLCYSAHAPNPLNLMERDNLELHREVFHASLEFCAQTGIDVIVYHPGRYLPEEEFAINSRIDIGSDEKIRLLEQEATLLREAADAFPGIVIAMENARPYLHHSPYCYAEIPSGLKSQVEAINRKNVRITMDFGHLHLSARYYGFDAVEEMRSLSPLIAHCHVHDNFGASVNYSEKIQTHLIPFGKGDAHMPVGWGNIPFEEYLMEMIDEFDGILICELRGRYFDHTGESVRNLGVILHTVGVGTKLAELSVT